ncbi:amino acid adenylation domain-containing protein [Mycobacterium kansasii]
MDPQTPTAAATAPNDRARRSLAAAVLDQVRRTPEAPAVVDGDRVLAYDDLERLSATVARGLHAAGIGPGQAVAICLPRSWQLVCVMLGIRRAGATVVPLDADSPVTRQHHILADSGSVAVVCATPETAPTPASVRALRVADLLDAGPGPLDRVDAPPQDPGFVFYTSGTTGLPKGVEVCDAGILRLAEPGWLRFDPGTRVASMSNPAFDALTFEVWTPLLTGGTCVVFGGLGLNGSTGLNGQAHLQTPRRLAEALRRSRIDTVFVTTALFNTLIDAVPDCFATVSRVLIGGEQLDAARIRRWYRDNPASATELVNVYGPTECTTFALYHPIPADFAGDVVPIGRPLPSTAAVLVADGNRAAAAGELAELYLSGAGLADGYRNLADETASRFVRLPWHDDGVQRWYRTGDLVRRDEAGLIVFVGRADRQVKVRGFRIEPAEVERQLAAHPAIRQVRVCTRRHPDGRHELLAYLVLAANLTFDAYHRHLADTVAPYMRPQHTYVVDALPHTANGKVDEAALLNCAVAPWRRPRTVECHAGATLRELLELAGGVLGVADLAASDRFVTSGGDSLTALRLRFEIQRRWQVDVPPADVIGKDFAALADAIDTGAHAGHYPPVPAPTGLRSAPATSEQQRLWLLQQRDPQNRAYDVRLAFQLQGAPDVAALRVAVCRLVARHPALRTGLRAALDGLRQEVGDPYDPWDSVDARDGEAWQLTADRFFAPAFDLAQPRMLRAGLAPHGDFGGSARPAATGGFMLLLHLHHIAVDGISLNVLFRELSADYAALAAGQALPEHRPAHTPVEATLWQRDLRCSPGYQDQRRALRRHYAELEWPAQPAEPAGGNARLFHSSLDAGQRAGIARLAAELGLTRFQLLLAAFTWSLYGVTGRTRPIVATPVAGRPMAEFESAVGMFANTVLLPVDLAPDAQLRAQLQRQAVATQEVLNRQDVTLADVLTDTPLPAGCSPLEFLFVLENTDYGALALPDCGVRHLWPRPAQAKCPLTLFVLEGEAGFDCVWEYAEDVFDGDRIQAAAQLFGRAVDLLTSDRSGTLTELAAPYRADVAGHGRGPRSTFVTVAEGFARQVARTPHAPAVTTRERTLCYAELDAQAAALAAQLPRPSDPAAPARVAIYLPPSAEHVVALLAAARLNFTAVPLDPAYPAELLGQILRQAEPLCVLVLPGAEAEVAAVVPDGVPRLVVTLAPAAPALPFAAAPHDGRRPLYTLFTSGSTGTPKGVDVPDRTLCNLLHWQSEHGGLAGAAVTQQFAALSFDVSFQEIFTTLCSGGRLHLVDPAWRRDLPQLLDQLETAGAERLFLPYVALQLLAEHGVRLGRYPSRLREVITAGEQLICTPAIRTWFARLPGARLFNHYGPTETHVVSALVLDGDPETWPERPAIGRPVANAVLRVVDDTGDPVAPGVTGRLLIGGQMAAPCYLGDAELNRTRFTAVPGQGLFYRSGDLAHVDHNGLFHYDGRDDQQLKISGHRLELGQVEAALLRHPRIVGAVVIPANGSLRALVQCHGTDDPSVDELNSHLAGLLPAHARIADFRRVDALPLTPSGKLDRRGAATVPGRQLATVIAWRDVSALESRLYGEFLAATGKPLRPDQKFFDAGATSLDLMRFQQRCSTELGLPFTVADLFEFLSIRELSRHLETSQASAAPAPGPRPAAGEHRDGPVAEPIAIVGMAVRAPGAADLASLWQLVETGGSGVEHFEAADGLVGARSQLDGMLAFDPDRFGISHRHARLMDPQQRHLLMSCTAALAHAGIAEPGAARVGLVATGGYDTYYEAMMREADPAELPSGLSMEILHEKNFLAAKAAYYLQLTGPVFTAQAACASSLVAVHLAAGLLREDDADVMLVAGVNVDTALTDGYRHRPHYFLAPDGICRPFSDDAEGTLGASGVAVVVLKRLSQAERDGDTVHAVITGSAINNDGSRKHSFMAPSVAGQRTVIAQALRRSGRRATEIGYVEAHGTATRLGDPVEVTALQQGYGLTEPASCGLSSLKSQVGHLGVAAGVAGLIRAALAVRNGVIPPNINFRRLSPEIGDGAVPFYIPTEARPWPAQRARVAAVSSFGAGGINAHAIVEQGCESAATTPAVSCLLLSAHTETALRADAHRIADYLAAHPDNYPQVRRHLQAGRPPMRYRAATVPADAESAVAWLRTVVATQVPDAAPKRQLPAEGSSPHTLAQAWIDGAVIEWAPGSAQPPWNFPPPSFDLDDYDFPRACPEPRPGPVAAAGRRTAAPPARRLDRRRARALA